VNIEAPTAQGNLRVYEKISLRDRQVGLQTFNGQPEPVISRATSRETAEKMLRERIEAGKAKYGGELTHSQVYEKTPSDGWLYSVAFYQTGGTVGTYHAVVYQDGSVAAY
jgi:hypothetical protein